MPAEFRGMWPTSETPLARKPLALPTTKVSHRRSETKLLDPHTKNGILPVLPQTIGVTFHVFRVTLVGRPPTFRFHLGLDGSGGRDLLYQKRFQREHLAAAQYSSNTETFLFVPELLHQLCRKAEHSRVWSRIEQPQSMISPPNHLKGNTEKMHLAWPVWPYNPRSR